MTGIRFDPDTAPTAPPARPADRRAARVQGLAMIVILGAGFVAGVAALTGTQGRQRVAQTVSVPAFLSGRLAGAVNHVMAHDLPGDPAWRAAGGIFRWRLFGAGGPQVTPGCPGWLFLTEELRPWPDVDAVMATRADAVRQIQAQAKARGVALLIALVPDKARIEANQLCHARSSAQARDRYARFVGLLRNRDLPVVDLGSLFATQPDRGTLFYRTDTHWSQRGAALAAAAVAQAVPAALFSRDHVWRTAPARADSARPGDLLRLMSLERVPDWPVLTLRPSPDRQSTETTELVTAPAAGGLLDAAPATPVVLLGSSFSLNGNFLGRLRQALGTDVSQFAEAGGAFSGAARAYFANSAWRDTPPKLIVWEIPERVVGQPISADERAWINGLEKPPATLSSLP